MGGLGGWGGVQQLRREERAKHLEPSRDSVGRNLSARGRGSFMLTFW